MSFNSDQPLRVTSTHSAAEFEGSILGIRAPMFAWVGLSLLSGLGLFTFLFYRCDLDFGNAIWPGSLPVIIVCLYFQLFDNKPAGFVFELIDSIITGGHAKPTQREDRRPDV